MPGEGPQTHALGSKAEHVVMLLQRYARVHNEVEKESTVVLLNELFPDIRCRHGKNGLEVFYLEDRVQKLPKALNYAASLVLVVRRDGTARVAKSNWASDEATSPGSIVPANDLLPLLGVKPARQSRWTLLGADEDWI